MDTFLIELLTGTIYSTWGTATAWSVMEKLIYFFGPFIIFGIYYWLWEKWGSQDIRDELWKPFRLVIFIYIILAAVMVTLNYFREAYGINTELKQENVSLKMDNSNLKSKLDKMQSSESVK